MASHDKLQIIFYAPFGKNTPANKIGGAEAGCLKTLDIYRNADIEVHCIDKPARNGSNARYMLDLIGAGAKLCGNMIAHPRAIVHIVGFYDKIIDIELMLMRLTRLFGRKSVYEIRNGGMVDIYNKRDQAYRDKQERIFRLATGILCQGEIFVDFIKNKFGLPSFYYPNYILDSFVKPRQQRTTNSLNLIFFGRLVPTKNIDVIIKATHIVWQKHPETKLYLIGGISKEYEEDIFSLIKSIGLPPEVVTLYHRKNFDFIAERLQQSHYFIFPSSEPCEGHSNSLTEAMGCGVVPIVSTAGFNRSICGDNSLVVESLNPDDYAKKILTIHDNQFWEQYSKQVYDRVSSLYTQSNVGKKLVNYLRSL